MAKDNDKKSETETAEVNADGTAKEAAEKAEAERVAGEKLKAEAAEKIRLEEERKHLVKMHRNGEIIHAHPTTIKNHEKNGWEVA